MTSEGAAPSVMAAPPGNQSGMLLDLVSMDFLETIETTDDVAPGSQALDRARDEALTRLVDVLLSATALLALLPFLVLIAVAVVATSPGPALFRQERCGRDGRPFEMLKFRTMRDGADREADALRDADGDRVDAPAYKSASDPRVTSLGRVLRRTSLDELPQLANILLGHMAFVGPRPLVWSEADALNTGVFAARHAVRPGLTGLWQVERRGDTSFAERMVMDVTYARTRTLRGDLVLILRTPMSAVRGEVCF